MFISLNPDQRSFSTGVHTKKSQNFTVALAFVQNKNYLFVHFFDESKAKFLSFSHPFKPVE